MEVNTSKKSLVHSYIISSIVSGEYPPGTVISEKSLVEKLDLSKSPVREALVELCNEGVLRNIPRFGYEVIRLTEDDVIDIRNFRLALECGFLLQFGNMITVEQRQELRTKLNQNVIGENGCIDVFKFWEVNADFHLTLFSFYRNQHAYYALRDAINRQSRAFAQFYWDKWKRMQFVPSKGFHEHMVNCLDAGNLNGAIEALDADIREYNGLIYQE